MNNPFLHLKLSTKLLIAPLVCLLFMVISGGVSFWGIRMQQATIQEMHSVRIVNDAKAGDLASSVDAIHTTMYRLISFSRAGYDQKRIEAASKDVQTILNRSGVALKAMASDGALNDEERNIVARIQESFTAYSKDALDMLDMIESDINAATMYMEQADEKFTTLSKRLDQFVALEASLNNASHTASTRSSNKVVALLAGVLLISVILSMLISYIVNRMVMIPIRGTVTVIGAMAHGDLTQRIAVASSDEIGDMARDMNEFIDSLHTTISAFSRSAVGLAAASAHLTATSERIATGAEQVASQAGTVATVGEEMSATSCDIAKNCQMAADAAQRAAVSAQNGASVVSGTIIVMDQISVNVQETARTIETLGVRSDQIGTIVGTIGDIADQTNLLALNAAIEAARAGEQGRGFAVVADEVRSLAERTTRATKEIGEMIKTIQKDTRNAVTAMDTGVRQVSTGTSETARSGAALQEILLQVTEVASQVNQIATAAEEQNAVTGEISSNMHQINEVVCDTASGAHATATAAADLSRSAEELQKLVRSFKL